MEADASGCADARGTAAAAGPGSKHAAAAGGWDNELPGAANQGSKTCSGAGGLPRPSEQWLGQLRCDVDSLVLHVEELSASHARCLLEGERRALFEKIQAVGAGAHEAAGRCAGRRLQAWGQGGSAL